MTLEIVFTEAEIKARVRALAAAVAAAPDPPEIVAPILIGAFMFAADLLRALADNGLLPPVEFLWLRSYADAREPTANIAILAPPGPAVRDRHVLLIDGVLDHGHTLVLATKLLEEAGARRITTIVAVDKARAGARIRADYAAFTGTDRFVVGYGMDDCGQGRGLPYIAAVS